MKVFGKGGKFNIIDVIVVLVLVAVIVFAVVHFVGKNAEDEAAVPVEEDAEVLDHPNLRFTVFFEKLPADLAENVVNSLEQKTVELHGEKLSSNQVYNARKLIPAKIVSWKTEPGEAGRTDLWLTVEARSEILQGAYLVGTQEVRLGNKHILKTLTVELTGIVSQMEAIGE